MEKKLEALKNLIQTVDTLQNPGGCPWDREQTVESLGQFVIEEAYEVVDAIATGEDEKIVEEVGDLMQVLVMLCRIAEGQGKYSIAEAAQGVADKLVRRHPHVFGDTEVSGSGEVLQNWEQIKQKEKKKGESAISGVPAALPGLLRAYRIGEKAARVGFKWKDLEGPKAKVEEEWGELSRAVESGQGVEEELGDLLFALVALSRHLEVNPEIALRKTVDRFAGRFRYVEQNLGKPMNSATLGEMEALWEKAKKEGL